MNYTVNKGSVQHKVYSLSNFTLRFLQRKQSLAHERCVKSITDSRDRPFRTPVSRVDETWYFVSASFGVIRHRPPTELRLVKLDASTLNLPTCSKSAIIIAPIPEVVRSSLRIWQNQNFFQPSKNSVTSQDQASFFNCN